MISRHARFSSLYGAPLVLVARDSRCSFHFCRSPERGRSMASNFTRGRVLQGVAVVFDGDIWVEDYSAKAGPIPWKAGYFSPQTTTVIAGDCRLELADGRTGTMTCMKSQPGMSGGSSLQFNGVGPLSGPGNKATEEFLPERIDLRVTRVEMELYQRAAQQENVSLTIWIRNRLREIVKADRS
jgi:hypothetical protein